MLNSRFKNSQLRFSPRFSIVASDCGELLCRIFPIDVKTNLNLAVLKSELKASKMASKNQDKTPDPSLLDASNENSNDATQSTNLNKISNSNQDTSFEKNKRIFEEFLDTIKQPTVSTAK